MNLDFQSFTSLKQPVLIFTLSALFLLSCGGSKKVSVDTDFLYEDDSEEILTESVIDEEEEITEAEHILRYENAIYQADIKTVLLHPTAFELGSPLIHSDLRDSLLLSFDDLSNSPKSYMYSLIHCNADWTPSDLLQNEYLEGFHEEPLINYEFSFNTIQPYVHYATTIPSANLRPILSGNYLVIVYPEGQKNKPILSERMMIIDEKVSVEGTVKRATDLEQRNYQHEIDFNIKHVGYTIDNPFGDIQVVLTQNDRWDNAITGLEAVFVKDNEITYDYEEENCFDGGNEYRFFDCQSLRYLSERLANISFENDTNKIILRTDTERRFQRYSGLVQDINGKRLIRVQEGSRNHIEADYALVTFSLPYEHEITHGDLFVHGQISDYGFPETHKMVYNKSEGKYESNIYLKQGYYNYEYVFKKNEGGSLSRFIEGTHYQTVNDYKIYIYHRPTGEQYDHLIGFQKLTSKDLL